MKKIMTLLVLGLVAYAWATSGMASTETNDLPTDTITYDDIINEYEIKVINQ